MKRRPKPQLTQRQVSLAIAVQSLRLADRWLVHWLNRPPTVARYQQAVPLSRVLSEHHAAVGAEPAGDHHNCIKQQYNANHDT